VGSIAGLADLGPAFLHVMKPPGQRELTRALRGQRPGAFILNPNTGREPTGPAALALTEDGTADMRAERAASLTAWRQRPRAFYNDQVNGEDAPAGSHTTRHRRAENQT
jgi:hypothetical protein